jgi:nucleotide-binding universal stress UspA family protein
LFILHVFEELGNVGYSIAKELEQRDREMLQKYQSRAEMLVTDTYVDVLEAKGNDVAEEILHTADKENIDTIVVGSRGINEAKEFLLGSVSYKVSHYAMLSYHCEIDRNSNGYRRYFPSSILHSFSNNKLWVQIKVVS